MDDSCSRRILCLTNDEAKSAKELSDACDLSLPSTYRRLNRLCELDLLSKRTHVTADGNHYNLYESEVVSVEVFLLDDEPEAVVKRRRDLVEEYVTLWKGLDESRQQSDDEDR